MTVSNYSLDRLPDNVLNQIISSITNTHDLISLSATNSVLHHLSNQRLYKTITIINKDKLLKPIHKSSISSHHKTQLVAKLSPHDVPQFVANLQRNKSQVPLIQHVIVAERMTEGLDVGLQNLVDLLIEFKVKHSRFSLHGLKSFQFLRSDYEYMQLNRYLLDSLSSLKQHETQIGFVPMYENDEDAFNNYNVKGGNGVNEKTTKLMKYQIFDLEEVKYLPDSEVNSLMISSLTSYSRHGNYAQVDYHDLLPNLSHLEKLEIVGPRSCARFFTAMIDKGVIFENLKDLSINLNSLSLFAEIMHQLVSNLNSLTSLNFKLSQSSINENDELINHQITEAFNKNLTNLKNVSIINLGPDQQNNCPYCSMVTHITLNR
ncbi:unnamed protein product [Ambrosiozyma monospora]|uniref:Unnamed protein product n=1 Tax=Ambrosiozyma monospora TaxID=43982 RepID=A0ACB5T3R7_AMBMO|nr:unnamed protein product [Ambrosiozyma monospora]